MGGKKINQPASKTNKTQTKKTKPNLDTVQQGLRISIKRDKINSDPGVKADYPGARITVALTSQWMTGDNGKSVSEHCDHVPFHLELFT